MHVRSTRNGQGCPVIDAGRFADDISGHCVVVSPLRRGFPAVAISTRGDAWPTLSRLARVRLLGALARGRFAPGWPARPALRRPKHIDGAEASFVAA